MARLFWCMLLTACCCDVTGLPALGQAKPKEQEKPYSKWKGHELAISSIAFAPNGKIFASAAHSVVPGEIRVWDASSRKELYVLPGGFRKVVFSPDGKTLAGIVEDDSSRKWTVCIWEVATGRKLGSLKNNKVGVMDFAFSPDGKTVITGYCGSDTGGTDPGMIGVWDTNTREERNQFPA